MKVFLEVGGCLEEQRCQMTDLSAADSWDRTSQLVEHTKKLKQNLETLRYTKSKVVVKYPEQLPEYPRVPLKYTSEYST